MRVESSVTSISWIPSESITGVIRAPLEIGFVHYDPPPPDVIANLASLRQSEQFRFANELRAWAEVEDGRVVDAGYAGQGHICPTRISLGVARMRVRPRPLPDLQAEPSLGGSSVTFEQTAGGRTGAPLPRLVDVPPFIRISAPVVWTTLRLTLHADGSSAWQVVGASKMPRHWIYDSKGRVVAKSGTIQFDEWMKGGRVDDTPWGGVDEPTPVTEAATALERVLSLQIMRDGERPEIRRHPPGTELTTQGRPGTELFLVLDGILDVEVDGDVLAEVGPGSVVGERCVLEKGLRTSTLRARTPVVVAAIDANSIDPAVLEMVAEGHRREDDR